jgi:hypothetical protein
LRAANRESAAATQKSTKYKRRNIEAEAIDGGAMTIGHPDLARAVIEQS